MLKVNDSKKAEPTRTPALSPTPAARIPAPAARETAPADWRQSGSTCRYVRQWSALSNGRRPTMEDQQPPVLATTHSDRSCRWVTQSGWLSGLNSRNQNEDDQPTQNQNGSGFSL